MTGKKEKGERSKEAPPRLALIADRFTEPSVAERVLTAVEAGVPWVHLRDHEAPGAAFASAAQSLVERIRALSEGVRVSVNTRLAVAKKLNAGLHLGTRGPSVEAARSRLGSEALIGFSAHDERESAAAVEAGVQYLFFSPIFPTESKPGHPGLGLETLCAYCKAFPEMPVLALGGITPERVLACRRAGAHGVAVLSGILHAGDPAAAVHAYLDALSASVNRAFNAQNS